MLWPSFSSPQVAVPLSADTTTTVRDENTQLSFQSHQIALCAASNGPDRLQAQAPPPQAPRVYPAVAFPRSLLNNGWKLPPEAHEVMDRLDATVSVSTSKSSSIQSLVGNVMDGGIFI